MMKMRRKSSETRRNIFFILFLFYTVCTFYLPPELFLLIHAHIPMIPLFLSPRFSLYALDSKEAHGDMVSGPSCHKCKRPGHIARDCRSGGPPSFGGDQGPRRRNKEKCYKCNQFGHFARECKEEGDRCYRCKGEFHSIAISTMNGRRSGGRKTRIENKWRHRVRHSE